jgi:glycosyltransferase involved in cell wall biosynthesis
MRKPRLVSLLDDFALGGVTKGLGVFESDPVRKVVDSSVTAIDSNAVIAPRLDGDIIVTHFPPNWRRLIFLATLKWRNPQARIIHVEHTYTRSWEQLCVSRRRRFRLMLKLSFGLVDQVVAMSSGQARWLAEASGKAGAEIDVIYPYSTHPRIEFMTIPDFSTPRKLRIGAYGRFHEAKGFDKLITAWKSGALPGTELLIGGCGPEEDRLCALADGAPGITFVGRIEDVPAFLEKCDIIAVPSNWEAYGQVANEAREAGRPILVSGVDGLHEQVGGAGLVVDFSDPDAVAKAFNALDSDRLTAMSKAAKLATRDCGPIRQHQWANLLRRQLQDRGYHRRRYGPA